MAKREKHSYRVLIGCANDKTGKRYMPGELVRDGDFSSEIILEWLACDPPVLEPVNTQIKEKPDGDHTLG